MKVRCVNFFRYKLLKLNIKSFPDNFGLCDAAKLHTLCCTIHAVDSSHWQVLSILGAIFMMVSE